MRISGQLVDAATGTHLWADRFEGTLENVFELQDQMTANVVAAIEPNLRAAEIQRAQRKPTDNLQAYDLLLRALPHFYVRTRERLEEAERLLRKAIEIDPTYPLARVYLSLSLWASVSQNWRDRSDPAVADMVQLARAALTVDGNDPEVLEIAGFIIAVPGGDLNGGIALMERSLALNPNNAAAIGAAGALYAYIGDTRAAIAYLDRAARHNPIDQVPTSTCPMRSRILRRASTRRQSIGPRKRYRRTRTTLPRCVTGQRTSDCSVVWRKAGRSCSGCSGWCRTTPLCVRADTSSST